MERLHDVCSGRFRSVVKLGNFSCMANCYAGLNGRDRPRAVVAKVDLPIIASLDVHHPNEEELQCSYV